MTFENHGDMNVSTDRWQGIIYLLLNLVVSVAAQFVLKAAVAKLGPVAERDLVHYILSMVNLPIIFGLLLYASGTILWLLCLTKLDLSFAYPVATIQYLLVFLGAWLLFDETISLQRIIGMLVICLGVLVISLDKQL